MTEPILQARDLNKSFGPVHVLHDVNFDVYPGEVTALVGDNGAGKSTLVKCFAGINNIDSGEVIYEGNHVTISDPRAATALGIEFVYQDLALADNLDITQNMFLGRELTTVGSILSDGQMEKQARETLASLSVRTVSSVRQMIRHDRRSPRGVRNLNSSGIVCALTPAIFAPRFDRSTRMDGRSKCRPAS